MIFLGYSGFITTKVIDFSTFQKYQVQQTLDFT